MRNAVWARWVVGMAMLPRAAWACTVCGSSTGQQVRAGLFDGHFLHTALLIASPFPLFALLIAGVYFGMPELGVPDVQAGAR